MTKTCTRCGSKKNSTEFYKASKHKDGLQSYCKECMAPIRKRWNKENKLAIQKYSKEYHPKYYQAHKEKIDQTNKQNKIKIRDIVLQHYGNKCSKCGSVEKLELDHTDNDGAKHRIELFGSSRTAGTSFYYWLVNNKFKTSYELQLLCNVCHKTKTTKEKKASAKDQEG